MTSSAHITLRDAVAALLDAADTLFGATIVRSRHRPMAAHVDRQVNVSLVDSSAAEVVISHYDWTTRVHIECIARTTAAGDAEARADELLTLVLDVLLADGALVTAGAGQVAVRAIQWAGDEADTSISAAHAELHLRHLTVSTTIAAT